MFYRVPSVITGNLIMSVRNQRNLFGYDLQHQFYEGIYRITFNIKLRLDERFQFSHVLVTDMSFVWAWMYRNSLSTKLFAGFCHLQYIWIITSSGIANGRNFVDIYTKSCHFLNKICPFIYTLFH